MAEHGETQLLWTLPFYHFRAMLWRSAFRNGRPPFSQSGTGFSLTMKGKNMPYIQHLRTRIVTGAYHHSWVLKNDDGSVRDRFDGWGTNPDGSVDGNPFTAYGKPLKVHPDQPLKGDPEVLDTYTGDDVEQRWQSGQAAAAKINADPAQYEGADHTDFDTHESVPATNSNSVASTLGKAMGFTMDDSEPDDSPGWGRDLLPGYSPPASITPVPLSSADPDGGNAASTSQTSLDADDDTLTDQDVADLTPDFASRNVALMDDRMDADA
jgi:hypothetical protein